MDNKLQPAPRGRPGDLIIDRYLPDASPEDRERAREVLREYALLLIRMGDRIMRDNEASPPGKGKEGEGLREVPEVHKSC